MECEKFINSSLNSIAGLKIDYFQSFDSIKALDYCSIAGIWAYRKLESKYYVSYTSGLDQLFYTDFMCDSLFKKVYQDVLYVASKEYVRRFSINYSDISEYIEDVKTIEVTCYDCNDAAFESFKEFVENLKQQLIKNPASFCKFFEQKKEENHELFVRCFGL